MAPEKLNFVHTCNLLSRYMKEKGSLKDLNLEIGGKVESLEALVKSKSPFPAPPATDSSIDEGKSNYPLNPQYSSIDAPQDASRKPTSKDTTAKFDSNTSPQDASHKSTSKDTTSKLDSKTSQLTIFYSGRVMVFDDYPADKVKELVAVARKASSQMSYAISSSTLPEKSSPPAPLPPRPQTPNGSVLRISSNTCKEQANGGTMAVAEARAQPRPEAGGSDLPIARRSSIHRFIEKRKDRAGARGPYHHVQEQQTSSSKGDENLDLKL